MRLRSVASIEFLPEYRGQLARFRLIRIVKILFIWAVSIEKNWLCKTIIERISLNLAIWARYSAKIQSVLRYIVIRRKNYVIWKNWLDVGKKIGCGPTYFTNFFLEIYQLFLALFPNIFVPNISQTPSQHFSKKSVGPTFLSCSTCRVPISF